MEPLREVEKKYCSRALFVAIVIGGILIACGLTGLGKGLILGCLFSIINFIALGGTIPMRLGKAKRKVYAIALGSLAGRMFLLAVPMIIAIKMEEINLAATMVGLFLVQVVILADYLSAAVISGFRKKLSGDI